MCLKCSAVSLNQLYVNSKKQDSNPLQQQLDLLEDLLQVQAELILQK